MLPGDTFPLESRARMRLHQLSGRARRGVGSELESASASGSAPVPITDDRRKRSLEILNQELHQMVVENPATAFGQEEARTALNEADKALRRLQAEGPDATLSPSEDIMLEAVVKTDGSRPSVPVQDGFIDPSNSMLGDWADDLAIDQAAVRRAIASTGRLIRGGDLSPDSVFGTSWVIGPGLIATAQHVLEDLYVLHDGQWVERFGGEITIDFHVEADRPARPADRVRILGVEKASPDLIAGTLNLANLDAAILRMDLTGPAPPPPLVMAKKIAPHGDPRIHVVGHPARPFHTVPDDPSVPVEELTALTGRILDLVFGDNFGVKRWSPGEFVINVGGIEADLHHRVMTHDASTLGGNSGSPVFDFYATPDRVVGLHYAGRFREANYCHPTARIADHFGLPGVVFV